MRLDLETFENCLRQPQDKQVEVCRAVVLKR